MASRLKGKFAIVGVGETKLGKLPDWTTLGLHLDAIKRAVEDAGLKIQDVDGLVTNQPLEDTHRSYAVRVAHAAGINPTYATDLALGGATPCAMVQHAVMAIDAGLCKTVVCVHARKQATRHQTPTRGQPLRDGEEDFEEPFGLYGAVVNHAMAARRHMFEYGTKSEDLAEIAVATRGHACLNPAATMRKPITVADHQGSRWIVEPLRLLDCCLVSDGGGAVVVTSAARAKDLRRPAVYVLGFGQHHPHFSLLEARSLTTLGGKVSAERAFKMAGLRPSDMHFAEIYDCFTITTLITLEDYGFCKKGEGKDWVKNGRIALGGELPVNTHGGLLSQAHIEGMLHVTEAVRQLRWDDVEPERQAKECRYGVVSGHGAALSMHATLVLGREPA
ncbi:MAG: thiolase family protein [Deltaproteobacteria bacterium]|nr:thiolase family protein [Deltaproteobacteria bacterium]MBI3077138.1 thiolase family protein [Deltaproteobacteria bacterium]